MVGRTLMQSSCCQELAKESPNSLSGTCKRKPKSKNNRKESERVRVLHKDSPFPLYIEVVR